MRKARYSWIVQTAAAFITAGLSFGCEGELLPDPVKAQSTVGIVNGTKTDYQSWKSVLMVETVDVRCTGTLIHPRVVLTAGHCILEISEAGILEYDLSADPSQIRIAGGADGKTILSGVEEVVLHPEWTGTIGMEAPDLVMLLLSEEINGLSPYMLRDFPAPAIGDDGIIVGYGTDPNDNEASGPVHRMGETTVLNITPYYYEIGGDTNTCSGDSGGPLFTDQDGEWVLTGVTSFGPEDCPAESDGYSVNLLFYCDWLNDTMMSLVGEDLQLVHCTSCKGESVSDWGEPCGPGYPCCPDGTECRLPEDFSRNELGYCAPACCDLGEANNTYCTDISDGEERCDLADKYGNAYCTVECTDDTECPSGTVCKNKPFASEKICIAEESGPGPECMDTVNAETDGTTTPDTGSDGKTDTEKSQGTDTDTSAGADCGCAVSGAFVNDFLFGLLLTILPIISSSL